MVVIANYLVSLCFAHRKTTRAFCPSRKSSLCCALQTSEHLYSQPLKIIPDVHLSDSQENFPAIHPEQCCPVNDQHTPANEQRFVGLAENFEAVLAQVSLQRGGEEAGQQLGDAVSGDRIHPDDDQWERPPLHSLHVNQRIEPRRQQKTPAAAE